MNRKPQNRNEKIVRSLFIGVLAFSFIFTTSIPGYSRTGAELERLRPRATSQSGIAAKIEAAVGAVGGVEALQRTYKENGKSGLIALLAEKALDGVTDPNERKLIEQGIVVVEVKGKIYLASSIDNGWKLDLTDTKAEMEPFASAEECGGFISSGQLTYIFTPTTEYTPQQIIDAQDATKRYLEEAGRDKRLFTQEDLDKQIAAYAAERTSVRRQLPYLDKKGQEALNARLEKEFAFHQDAINAINETHIERIGLKAFFPLFKDATETVNTKTALKKIQQALLNQNEVRQVIVYDEEDRPSFFQRGKVDDIRFIAVTASAGGYKYEGFENTERYKQGLPPQSIYKNSAIIEGYMALGEEAKDAYIYKLLHEFLELQQPAKGHRVENKSIISRINRYDTRVFDMWKEKEEAAAAKKLEKEKAKVVGEVTQANIAKFLKPDLDGVIDPRLIKVAEEELFKMVDNGLLTDYKVWTNGGDINIFSTRPNAQAEEDDAKIASQIMDIYLAVLKEADNLGLSSGEDISQKTYLEQVRALEIRDLFRPMKYSERAAEPLAVISASRAYAGGLNLLVYEIFKKASGKVIDPAMKPGFIFEVLDKTKNEVLRFDLETEEDKLLALISQSGLYQVSAVYPKKGHKIPAEEPVAVISLKRVADNGYSPVGDDNPVLICRSQSGLPAWGEIIDPFGRENPILTYGGEKTRHILAMRPTDIEEAAKIGDSEHKLFSILTGFGFQSHAKGKIGISEDIGGHQTLNPVREKAEEWERIFTNVPTHALNTKIQPFLRPHSYNINDEVAETRQRRNSRFQKNPDLKTETDPLLQEKGDFGISTIKADIGSLPGHFEPHPVTILASEEMLQIAKEYGFEAVETFKTLTKDIPKFISMIAEKSGLSPETVEKEIDNLITQKAREYLEFRKDRKPTTKEINEVKAQIDLPAGVFLALVRKYDLITPALIEERLIDFRVWNAGDDVQLTMTHHQPSDDKQFIHPLALSTFWYAVDQTMPFGLYGRGQDLLVDRSVSGNVQGMGPGYAEVQCRKGDRLIANSADKSAPGAYTIPIIAWSLQMLDRGLFKEGLIWEVWDLNNKPRAFFDVTNKQDLKDALALLSSPDDFAIKRVWKTTRAWDGEENISNALDPLPIIAASTERLILTAGKYVGKDDPTLLFRLTPEIAEVFSPEEITDIFQYPQVVLGFMRGSHIGPLVPGSPAFLKSGMAGEDQKKALATPHLFDGPPPVAELLISSEKGDGVISEVKDAFAEAPFLTEAIKKGNTITQGLRRNEVFSPMISEGMMEYTTLPENLAAIEAEGRTVPAGPSTDAQYYKALLSEQNEGESITQKLTAKALSAAKDKSDPKVILMHSSSLRNESSLAFAVEILQRQTNNQLGIFNSPEQSMENAYRLVLVMDDKAVSTEEDVDKFFEAVSQSTGGAAQLTREMFAKVVTPKDVRGKISNPKNLITSVKHLNIGPIKAVIGPGAWVDGLTKINEDILGLKVDSKPGEIAFASNALFAAIEALADSNGQIPDNLASKLSIEITANGMVVRSNKLKTRVEEDIQIYQSTMGEV